MTHTTNLRVGPRGAVGKAVLAQTGNITHADTTGKSLFVLPKGAKVVNFLISGVITGTTPTVNFGTTSTATEYLNAEAVTSATAFARDISGVTAANVGAALKNGPDVLAADTTIFAKVGGTGLSAGDIDVTVIYVSP